MFDNQNVDSSVQLVKGVSIERLKREALTINSAESQKNPLASLLSSDSSDSISNNMLLGREDSGKMVMRINIPNSPEIRNLDIMSINHKHQGSEQSIADTRTESKQEDMDAIRDKLCQSSLN